MINLLQRYGAVLLFCFVFESNQAVCRWPGRFFRGNVVEMGVSGSWTNSGTTNKRILRQLHSNLRMCVCVCVCVHGECTALGQQIRVLETQGRGGEL
jgi:hypothetical protein